MTVVQRILVWFWPPYRRRYWKPTLERTNLGNILIDMGLVTVQQIQDAILHLQTQEEGVRIGESLVALGVITLEDLGEALILQGQLRNGKAVEAKTQMIARHFDKETRTLSEQWLIVETGK